LATQAEVRADHPPPKGSDRFPPNTRYYEILIAIQDSIVEHEDNEMMRPYRSGFDVVM
jgi:hypothetical protein